MQHAPLTKHQVLVFNLQLGTLARIIVHGHPQEVHGLLEASMGVLEDVLNLDGEAHPTANGFLRDDTHVDG